MGAGSAWSGEPFGCPVCGLFMGAPGRCPNVWCGRSDRSFSVVHAIGAHRGSLRRAVALYKYREEIWWADVFASMLGRYVADHPCWFEDFDLLTTVPVYLGPGSRRTWDPMGEVAEKLGPLLGPAWQVEKGLVRKRCETSPLQGQSGVERRRRASGELRRSLEVAHGDLIKGARVLVIDDVLTEGSTLNEVARSLLLAGATEVAGLVIARPEWSVTPPMAGSSRGRAGCGDVRVDLCSMRG